jgi:hypothetical protein
MARFHAFVAALVLMAVVLLGCGSPRPPEPPRIGAPETAAPSIASPFPNEPTVDAPSQPLPGLACTSQQLTVATAQGSSASGSADFELVFTNRGEPCYLRGYPSLTGVDDSGRQLFQAAHTAVGAVVAPGGARVMPTVHLNSGESASAQWSYLSGQAADPDPRCPRNTSVRVSPPGVPGYVHWSPPEGGLRWTCLNEIGLITSRTPAH